MTLIWRRRWNSPKVGTPGSIVKMLRSLYGKSSTYFNWDHLQTCVSCKVYREITHFLHPTAPSWLISKIMHFMDFIVNFFKKVTFCKIYDLSVYPIQDLQTYHGSNLKGRIPTLAVPSSMNKAIWMSLLRRRSQNYVFAHFSVLSSIVYQVRSFFLFPCDKLLYFTPICNINISLGM